MMIQSMLEVMEVPSTRLERLPVPLVESHRTDFGLT